MSGRSNESKLARALLRIPVPWAFVLTYLAGAALEAKFHVGRSLLDYEFFTPVGIVVFVMGAGVAAWGWFHFYRAKTTRIPGEASTTLVTWGPYRFTRNPMYLGLFIAYVGEAGILHQVIPPYSFASDRHVLEPGCHPSRRATAARGVWPSVRSV